MEKIILFEKAKEIARNATEIYDQTGLDEICQGMMLAVQVLGFDWRFIDEIYTIIGELKIG